MSSRTLVALLAVSMVLQLPGLAAVGGGAPSPMDSGADHEAGHVNLTFVDTYSSTINVTAYYPALSGGEGATPDASAAPYPVLLLLHQRSIAPPSAYYSSYGVNLSRHGYVVLLADMSPHDTTTPRHERMANASLEALDMAVAEGATATSRLYGMVNASAMAVAGHGQGARVALMAAIEDGGDDVAAVACIDLTDDGAGGYLPNETGRIERPFHIQYAAGSIPQLGAWARDAFSHKAGGYVSIHGLAGTSSKGILDADPPSWPFYESPSGLSRGVQQNRSQSYLTAFLDRHLKGDALAGSRLYGAIARADLEDGALVEWRYGVLDMSIGVARPQQGSTIPTGLTSVCATVTNVGPFPLPTRNVTVEVARVVPGVRAFVRVFGPVNGSTGPLAAGQRVTLRWIVTLTEYGQHVAFLRMDDPDHNGSNDRAQSTFDVSPLLPPTVGHDPPEALELGEPFVLRATLDSPSGIESAHVNYTDEDGLTSDIPLQRQGASDDWEALMPAPRSVGQVYYRFTVVASSGAVNVTEPNIVPVVDTTPPELVHLPPDGPLSVSTQPELCATVTDRGHVQEVTLRYWEPTTGTHNVTCARRGDEFYYPVDLGPREGVLNYTWQAMDSWGNRALLGPYLVDVVDGRAPVIEATSHDPVELGEDLELSARITEDSQVVNVTITYVMPGETFQRTGEPVQVGPLWRLTLPRTEHAGALVYEWSARDLNDNVATTGEMSVEVVDTTPPEVSNVTTEDAEVGKGPVVRATVTDLASVGSVSLNYTGVNGSPEVVGMLEGPPGEWTGRMATMGRGGLVSYTIVAEDGSGNRVETSVRTFVVRDLEPPVIVHTLPERAVEGSDLTLSVTVIDNAGVASVELYLRLIPAGAFERFALEDPVDGTYSHTIDGLELEPPDVQYYFVAEDLEPSSNVAHSPSDAPTSVFSLNVSALELDVFGVVKDGSGEPVGGVTVAVEAAGIDATSGGDGSYRLQGLHTGTHTLVASAEGYKTISFDVTLTAQQGSRELNLTLLRLPPDGDGDDQGTYFAIGVLALVAAVLVALFAFRRAGSG